MEESDKELLELAAKAAGIGGGWDWPRGAKTPVGWRGADNKIWNPLADDGDALRLAVNLRLEVYIHEMDTRSVGCNLRYATEYHGKDPYTATRRAIVRAAAEIGKQKD